MTFLYYTFVFLFLFMSVLLCGVILMQESKSSGLGALSGGEASDSLLGTAAPEILKKITAWLAAIFLGSCIVLSMWTGAMGRAKQRAAAQSEMIEQ